MERLAYNAWMLTWLAAFVMAVALGAQNDPATGRQSRKETAHLAIATSVSKVSAAPGGRVELQMDVTPKPRMHVYAPGQDGYIAVNLKLDPDSAFTAATAKYPAGEKILVKALNETQLVYDKPFRITQDITIGTSPEMKTRASADEPITIKGTLRYQACDDKVCYLPTNVPVEWSIRLTSNPPQHH